MLSAVLLGLVHGLALAPDEVEFGLQLRDALVAFGQAASSPKYSLTASEMARYKSLA